MEHPWETIYREQGPIFHEPFPRFAEVVQTFQDHGCQTVLDLGCGNGRHTVHLARAGFTVTGLDISPTGLKLAQKWLADEKLPVSLLLADSKRPFPFKDGAFEALLSTQVIHHALRAEVLATIAEIYRILALGGLAFVSVAGKIHDDTDYVQLEPDTYLPQSGSESGLPHHIFNPTTLRQAFSTFRVVYVEYRDGGRVIVALVQKI